MMAYQKADGLPLTTFIVSVQLKPSPRILQRRFERLQRVAK